MYWSESSEKNSQALTSNRLSCVLGKLGLWVKVCGEVCAELCLVLTCTCVCVAH